MSHLFLTLLVIFAQNKLGGRAHDRLNLTIAALAQKTCLCIMKLPDAQGRRVNYHACTILSNPGYRSWVGGLTELREG